MPNNTLSFKSRSQGHRPILNRTSGNIIGFNDVQLKFPVLTLLPVPVKMTKSIHVCNGILTFTDVGANWTHLPKLEDYTVMYIGCKQNRHQHEYLSM